MLSLARLHHFPWKLPLPLTLLRVALTSQNGPKHGELSNCAKHHSLPLPQDVTVPSDTRCLLWMLAASSSCPLAPPAIMFLWVSQPTAEALQGGGLRGLWQEEGRMCPAAIFLLLKLVWIESSVKN